MEWQPIVDGKLKTDLESKIDEITGLLLDKKNIPESPGLLGGKAGMSLFFFCEAARTGNDALAERGMQLLEEVFDSVNQGFHDFRLSSGLAGIGWTVHTLNREGYIETDTDEILGEIDDFIGQTMVAEMDRGSFDFLHSASGNVLYLLYRLNGKTVRGHLKQYLKNLEKASLPEEDGSIKWESVLNIEDGTKGYNFSLSHGMASIIGVLGKMVEAGVEAEKASALTRATVTYMLKHRLDRSKFYSHFPSSIRMDSPEPMPSRLAWCYGDLGTATSLLLTARRLKQADWEQTALEILLDSTRRRTPQETLFMDAGICHGTAGVAHIYNRLFHYTGREEFREAAVHWFADTLNWTKYTDGAAGYKAHRTEKHGGPVAEYGFLEGIAGIAMTMISAVAPVNPAWDESLLLS